jgi:hypothetical protein
MTRPHVATLPVPRRRSPLVPIPREVVSNPARCCNCGREIWREEQRQERSRIVCGDGCAAGEKERRG